MKNTTFLLFVLAARLLQTDNACRYSVNRDIVTNDKISVINTD